MPSRWMERNGTTRTATVMATTRTAPWETGSPTVLSVGRPDRDGHAAEDDAFVNDPTQWNDTDGDGYGDNANGSVQIDSRTTPANGTTLTATASGTA